MSINKFNTGRDVAVDFIAPSGPKRFSNITEFHSSPRNKEESSSGIDGVTMFQFIPQGWGGTIAVDRFNRVLDDSNYEFEQLYFSGQNVPACTITETVKEPDGTISQWRYENVVFQLADAGAKNQGGKIGQRLEFRASFKKRVI